MGAGEDPSEVGLDLLGKVRTARQDGEVEVFGEAVGLDVALLQARAALEDPLVSENGIGTDAPQQPAEQVVLFDHLLGELPLGYPFDDVRSADHHSPPGWPRATLTRSPHLRRIRSPF